MVDPIIVNRLCDEFDNERPHIEALLELLTSGATTPYIARYCREATGNMDWTRIQDIERRFRFLEHIERRKERFLEKQEKAGHKLDLQVVEEIRNTFDPARFEDLSRPHLPSRGGQGRKGVDLERIRPLVERLTGEPLEGRTMMEAAAEMVDAQAGFPDPASVLEQVTRLVAERLAADGEVRHKVREKLRQGVLHVRKTEKKKGAERYNEYDGLREPLSRIPAEKLFRILRGHREKNLTREILIDQVPIAAAMEAHHFPFLEKAPADQKRFLQDAVRSCLTRVIIPECTGAVLEEIRDRRGREAVKPIQAQLRSLLMAPPFPGQTVMALDPGPRDEIRLVVASPDGSFLDDDTISMAAEKAEETATRLGETLEKFGISIIAVAAARGRGLKVKAFLRRILRESGRRIPVETVNDAGSRNWSTSRAAAQELPDVEPASRAALSLARRILDPFAEYAKLENLSLLVAGSRAIDIPPRMLRSALNDLVEECVAEIGPDLNYAGVETLALIPGLDSRLARELDLKRAGSRFRNLEQIREMEVINENTYRNCAGFLRIHESTNPLDVTQIHPDRHKLVGRMAEMLQVPVAELLGNREKLEELDPESLVDEKTCLETLHQIKEELILNGRDPRGTYRVVEPPEGLNQLEDLEVEMNLRGRITRVADFGVFVDVGVEPEGLVHESRIPRQGGKLDLSSFIMGQVVEVRVVHIDKKNRRLALSMLPAGPPPGKDRQKKPYGGGGEGEGRSRRPRQGPGREGGERERSFSRRRPRDRDRGGYGRSTEKVFRARGVKNEGEPEKTHKGELTDLSDLKSLLQTPAPKKEKKPSPLPPEEGRPPLEQEPAERALPENTPQEKPDSPAAAGGDDRPAPPGTESDGTDGKRPEEATSPGQEPQEKPDSPATAEGDQASSPGERAEESSPAPTEGAEPGPVPPPAPTQEEPGPAPSPPVTPVEAPREGADRDGEPASGPDTGARESEGPPPAEREEPEKKEGPAGDSA